MSFLFGGGGNKSKSTTDQTTQQQQDPWAPAMPYLTEALGTGKQIFDEHKTLTPEEEAARQGQIGVLKSRMQDPFLDQLRSAGSSLLSGSTMPNLADPGQISAGGTASSVLRPSGMNLRPGDMLKDRISQTFSQPMAGMRDPNAVADPAMKARAMADGSTPDDFGAPRAPSTQSFAQTMMGLKGMNKPQTSPAGLPSLPNGAGGDQAAKDIAMMRDNALSRSQTSPQVAPPEIRSFSPPPATAPSTNTAPTQTSAVASRAAQGVLDPTGALSKSLSGQVDNTQLDRMAESATRAQQRAYGDALQDSDESLTRSVLPAIRSGAVQAGGYGGSRQAIAEGLAISDRNKNLDRAARDLGIASGDATANLKGAAYERAQDRMASTADSLDSRALSEAVNNADRAQSGQQFDKSLNQRDKEFGSTMGENARQFDTQTAEGRRQFDTTTGEGRRQFDTSMGQRDKEFGSTLGENRRQFDTSTGENRRQFDSSLGQRDKEFSGTLGENKRQFDTGTSLDAKKFDISTGLDVGKTNAGLTLQKNAQDIQRAALLPQLMGAGAQLYGDASNWSDDDYAQLMSVLGLPRSLSFDAYGNYVSPLTGIAGLGGQGTGRTTGSSKTSGMNFNFAVGK